MKLQLYFVEIGSWTAADLGLEEGGAQPTIGPKIRKLTIFLIGLFTKIRSNDHTQLTHSRSHCFEGEWFSRTRTV